MASSVSWPTPKRRRRRAYRCRSAARRGCGIVPAGDARRASISSASPRRRPTINGCRPCSPTRRALSITCRSPALPAPRRRTPARSRRGRAHQTAHQASGLRRLRRAHRRAGARDRARRRRRRGRLGAGRRGRQEPRPRGQGDAGNSAPRLPISSARLPTACAGRAASSPTPRAYDQLARRRATFMRCTESPARWLQIMASRTSLSAW